jgi:cytochrome P450
MHKSAQLRTSPPGPQDEIDLGSTEDSLDRMLRYFREYGDVYRVYSPGRRSHTWVISHPDDVKRVLVTNHRNYTKGVGLDRVRILLGNGIMVSEGEFWRRQRLMIQPAFHRRVVERFAGVVRDANMARLEHWDRVAAAGERLNITTEMSELTLEIVLRAIFGADLATLTDRHGDNPFAVVTREPARNLQFAFRFRSLAGLVADIVRRRRDGAESGHFDFLAMLMAARDADTGEAMSERELTDEVLTLIVAGHETTASGLNWTWYLVARHPEAAARLRAEAEARGELADFSLKSLESLEFTQQVIHEALRLYPPGWLITRRSIGADRLGGYELPPGTDVFLSPYVIHRHPAYWEEPERFLPARFTAAAAERRPRYAYIPFVAGPRHCIGETFALYEMAMHVCMAARRFEFAYVDAGPVAVEAQINLRTARDLHFRLTRLEHVEPRSSTSATR